MRTISIRTVALGAIALAALVRVSAAQTPPAILNALEVRKLVTSNEPADNARLSAHFAALADRYAAQAKRHTAMAQAFMASPGRRSADTGSVDHCRRLATLNNQSADTLRELAAYHAKVAAGAAAKPPAGGAGFQAGAGAPEPTDKELAALASKASTPADHNGLAEYFALAAHGYTADAKEHEAMAAAYRGTRIAQAAVHCDRLVTLLRDEAKEATAAAEMHKRLAKAAK